jgi:hypothetical protein
MLENSLVIGGTPSSNSQHLKKVIFELVSNIYMYKWDPICVHNPITSNFGFNIQNIKMNNAKKQKTQTFIPRKIKLL